MRSSHLVCVVDDTPDKALAQARAAADGRDVRLGGGARTIRAFLLADPVDTPYVAVSPWSSSEHQALAVPGRAR